MLFSPSWVLLPALSAGIIHLLHTQKIYPDHKRNLSRKYQQFSNNLHGYSSAWKKLSSAEITKHPKRYTPTYFPLSYYQPF